MDRNVPRGAPCRVYSLDSKHPAGQPLPAHALIQRIVRAGRFDWMADGGAKAGNNPSTASPVYRAQR